MTTVDAATPSIEDARESLYEAIKAASERNIIEQSGAPRRLSSFP